MLVLQAAILWSNQLANRCILWAPIVQAERMLRDGSGDAVVDRKVFAPSANEGGHQSRTPVRAAMMAVPEVMGFSVR